MTVAIVVTTYERGTAPTFLALGRLVWPDDYVNGQELRNIKTDSLTVRSNRCGKSLFDIYHPLNDNQLLFSPHAKMTWIHKQGSTM